MTAREARDHRPPYFEGDPPNRLGVGRGRDGETGFDDVDTQCVELTRKLDLLSWTQREARRLLAVTQGGVENPYLFHPYPHSRMLAVFQ